MNLYAVISYLLVLVNMTQSHPSRMEGATFVGKSRFRRSVDAFDCGFMAATRARTPQQPTPSVRSSSRGFSSSIRSLFPRNVAKVSKCWASQNVTESVSSDGDSQASIQFKVDQTSVENITQATLTFFLSSNITESSVEGASVPATKITGSVVALPNAQIGNETTEGISHLESLENSASLKFDVLEFINAAATRFHAEGHRNETLLVIFNVRRPCNSVISSDCPSVINTVIHRPSLRVKYT